jgi:uncharacterized protein YndB with AHSA1/START domain
VTKTQFTAEPGVPQILIVRRFDAPRELVFRAHVDPDLLVQWLGPTWLVTTVDRLEARDGGRWRIVHRDPDGGTYIFHGVYHGDPCPERIVRTYEFDNAPGPVYLDTITLEDLDGATLLRQNTVFQSVEDRDRYLVTGAEAGVRESMQRLGALVAELARKR